MGEKDSSVVFNCEMVTGRQVMLRTSVWLSVFSCTGMAWKGTGEGAKTRALGTELPASCAVVGVHPSHERTSTSAPMRPSACGRYLVCTCCVLIGGRVMVSVEKGSA